MTSIDRLIKAYQEEDPQPKNLQLVTDHEADEAFLKFRDTFWSILFFTVFAASILVPAVINR